MPAGIKRLVSDRLGVSQKLFVSRLLHGELPSQVHAAQFVRRTMRRPPAGFVASGGSTWAPRVARQVTSFDAWRTADENLQTLREALEHAGIEFAILPHRRELRRVVVVPERARGRAMGVLAALPGPAWHASRVDSSPAQGQPVTRLSRGTGDLTIFEYLADHRGALLGASELGVDLEFWSTVTTDTVPRADGGLYSPGTLRSRRANESARYLSPAAWQAAQNTSARWPGWASGVSVFEVSEPVDIVYTWVDDGDPRWRTKMREARAAVEVGAVNSSAVSESRFAMRDELKYSLRSVEMYASWVNRIYVVTDGQRPGWLADADDRIRVVDHKDIFSDPGVLPVFNSHAIESQLHHIEGLSDRYLYMNDDIFFGRPVSPEQFFEGNGVAKFFLSKALIDIDQPTLDDLPVTAAAKNNRHLLSQEADVLVRNKFKHTPHPQLRSVLEGLERTYPEEFSRVAAQRFRHPSDISVASSLHHYAAYVRRCAVRGEIDYAYQDVSDARTVLMFNELLRSRRYDVFCLNDTDSSPASLARQAELMGRFLSAYFPLPSTFETQGSRNDLEAH